MFFIQKGCTLGLIHSINFSENTEKQQDSASFNLKNKLVQFQNLTCEEYGILAQSPQFFSRKTLPNGSRAFNFPTCACLGYLMLKHKNKYLDYLQSENSPREFSRKNCFECTKHNNIWFIFLSFLMHPVQSFIN